MPKPSTKRVKTKATKPQLPDDQGYEMPDAAPAAPAAPVDTAPSSTDLQPPSTPVELAEEVQPVRPAPRRDQIATSINIAKLQAMTMTALNTMAKDLGVENFGISSLGCCRWRLSRSPA